MESLLQYPLHDAVVQSLHLVLNDTGRRHDVSLERWERERESKKFIILTEKMDNSHKT